MHTTLYRKWRPIDFASVVGQKHITDVLQYEIQNGKTTHAYLFCGSRGTGKTTCAKILAKAINCVSPVNGDPCGKCDNCRLVESGNATDIIEMDAASNNGVEYIRNIREEVVYTPAVLKKKVYIIDEVHMLSSSAFNALLKTLEEPPEHIVFILATTELQKLPATITSRCQRFDFRRISTDDIASRLEYIAMKENISLTHEAAKLIGRLSLGGMRDSISLFELCAGAGQTVDIDLVNKTAGVAGREILCSAATAVAKHDYEQIFGIVSGFSSSALDISVFWQDLISYYRDMLLIRSSQTPEKYLDLTEEEFKATKNVASLFTREKLLYNIRLLEEAFVTMQRSGSLKQIIAETTLIRMSDEKMSDSSSALLARISALEDKIQTGYFTDNKPVPHPAEVDAPAPDVQDGAESKSDVPGNGPEASSELRPIESWIEVADSVERINTPAAAMLKLTKPFFDGKKVIIKVRDKLTQMVLDKPEILSQIAASLSSVGEITSVSPDNIVFVTEQQKEDDDPIFNLENL